VQTRLGATVTIREGHAAAALEVMSRFAVDPHWLIYLPPTMSPCEASTRADLLEHPSDAFGYFRSRGIPAVVCEEKHMGSRAVLVVCRDETAARERFGIDGGAIGMCFTRTGRRFFAQSDLEQTLLDTVRRAAEHSGLWDALDTNWVCLDAELMPWSAKAEDLLDFVPTGRGRVQPAIKVRGREYLRIIYGPEYTLPEHLDRLRNRGLRAKRALAMQEFALGIEALERFVRREPLRRVHECVFGVLALESEPIDPRL